MKVLLSRPSSRVIAVVTLMAGLVTAGIRTRFAPLEEIMTRQGGVGIVPYEFAFTADRAQDILVGWAPRAVMRPAAACCSTMALCLPTRCCSAGSRC